MAYQHDVKHAHCKVCGSCFTGGLQYVHRCDITPPRRDILEVMLDEMRGTDEKTRIRNRIPSGFQEFKRV